MEKIRPILYGVADYAQLRKKNAWFVDRTAKLRDLEDIAYAVFLRPRRFGKSLLISMLRAYYDVQFAKVIAEALGMESLAGYQIGVNSSSTTRIIKVSVTGKDPDAAIDRIIDDNVSFSAFTPAT